MASSSATAIPADDIAISEFHVPSFLERTDDFKRLVRAASEICGWQVFQTTSDFADAEYIPAWVIYDAQRNGETLSYEELENRTVRWAEFTKRLGAGTLNWSIFHTTGIGYANLESSVFARRNTGSGTNGNGNDTANGTNGVDGNNGVNGSGVADANDSSGTA